LLSFNHSLLQLETVKKESVQLHVKYDIFQVSMVTNAAVIIFSASIPWELWLRVSIISMCVLHKLRFPWNLAWMWRVGRRANECYHLFIFNARYNILKTVILFYFQKTVIVAN